ncbi:hypothetical protein FWF74_00475 [Candidatus Saccharibacteria bacterium]|nr:hypothetical protein [Candidatus Saccharibacteria bacterium]MCL1963322.1 hypothetical protein [Candidatus Saccharibacteria bacterium]
MGRRIKIFAVAMLAGVLAFTSLINIANALEITDVIADQGPTAGGQRVTIYGDFKVQGERVVQISAGGRHTCALDNHNKIYCWGIGSTIGNGVNTNRAVPMAVNQTGVLNNKIIKQISAGRDHTCALDSDGKAYCWGNNFDRYGDDYGKLGSDFRSYYSLVPVAVSTADVLGGKTLTQISAGGYHACAIDSNGRAYCWGRGEYGQLGNDSTNGSFVPVAVDTSGILNGKTLIQIDAGITHTCAIDSDGQTYCWGGGWYGKLGNNSTANSLVPVAVDTAGALNGKTLTQISVGLTHTCTLGSNGQAYCWGDSGYGKLGNGYTDSSVPKAVNMTGLLYKKRLVYIGAGNDHTCTLGSNGQAYCWGYGLYGRLGNNATSNSASPVAVDVFGVLNGKTLTQMSVGGSHACAIDTDGRVYCWGAQCDGQVGDNVIDGCGGTPVPVMVHTVSIGTGSVLPDPYTLDFTVTFDVNGEPAECINVVIASDGKSLTCTTTAHDPGFVDVTINDGVNIRTLPDGYEYLAPLANHSSASHHITLNIYDSTSLATIIETCDQIKAEQAQNHSYTQESYNTLMEECEEGQNTLDCLEEALRNNTDTSECADPGEKKDDIEDAIDDLETAPVNPTNPNNPVVPTPPINRNSPISPNTGANSTWTITFLKKTYAIPILPFLTLSFATILAIGLTIYLIQKRIKEKGISGIKITKPWNKANYIKVYEQKLVKKHQDDPLTEIIDVSQIIRKYRIKFVLWHSVPVVAIVIAFFTLLFTTAPIMADPLSSITIAPINNVIINVDKKNEDLTQPNITKTATITTNVATDNETGYTLNARLGVNSDTAHATAAGIATSINAESLNHIETEIYKQNDDVNPDIHNNAFVATLPSDIANGVYTLTIVYEAIENEAAPVPDPEPLFTSAFDCADGWGGLNDYENVDYGRVGYMQDLTPSSFASWRIGDYGTVTDNRNNQDYVVCKLGDGHIWMLNNLKLGSTSGTTPLTPADTNITSNWSLPQLVVSGYAYGSSSAPRAYGPVSGATDNIADETFYGYLYNWCAATAGGTASGGSNTCTDSSIYPDDATNDICPVNWRLPTGGSTGEYTWLGAKLNNPNATSTDVYYRGDFIFTGSFRGVFSGGVSGSWYGQGSSGYWWSSSHNSSAYESASTLYIGSSSVSFNLSLIFRSHGHAVRCLLKY